MTKEQTKELEQLSDEVLGHKYAWRKLTRRGVVMRGTAEGEVPRRHPLTPEQAKDYMLKRQDMIQSLRKEIEDNAQKQRELANNEQGNTSEKI